MNGESEINDWINPETRNYDLLILYSGGADSTLLLELAKIVGKTPYWVLIDYGQKHIRELDMAREYLTKKNINFHTIKISNLKIDSGLTGDGFKNTSGVVHEMHVPGRNSIFLSCAFSIAEDRNIDTIWIGCDYSDAINLFPDCLQSYILEINNLFKVAGPKQIKVEAPLLGFSKDMVVKSLNHFGIGVDTIFSGYGDL